MPVSKVVSHDHPDVLLQQHSVSDLSGLYYVPDYLTTSQQDRLLESLRSSKSRWTQPLLTRIDHDFKLYQGPPNHVLLNSYEPGQGILAHEDGPAYFPAASIVSLGSSAVMHFRRKNDEGIDPKPCALVLLMPGSLLIFNQDAYERCLHGIDEVAEDVLDNSILNLKQCRQNAETVLSRALRYSLTIRRVPKVKRLVRLPGQT